MVVIKKSEIKEYLSHPKVARWYTAYIHSPKWIAFRAEIFKLRGKFCELCKATEKLTLHHKTYLRVTEEKPEDVQILCQLCHKRIHAANYIPWSGRIYDENYKEVKSWL